MKTEEKLVTVARFDNYVEADMARQVLEDQGVKAVVMGQNVGNVYSGVPAVIDIELQTFESQAMEARQILEDTTRPLASDESQDAEEEDWGDEQDQEQE
jgi:adenylyl- and sulfurtransferase ThiI